MSDNQTYIAKNGHLTKEGWIFLFQAARDIFINGSSIQGVRTVLEDELEIEESNMKVPPFELWPHSGSKTVCEKCGFKHNPGNPALRIYLYPLNAVKTQCIWCHHSWLEKCKDDTFPSDPNYIWMGPKNNTVEPNPLERFMIKLRNVAGETAVLYTNNNFSSLGGLDICLRWEFRGKNLFIKSSFTSQELDYIMENRSSLEGFLNIFYTDLERLIKEVESKNGGPDVSD